VSGRDRRDELEPEVVGIAEDEDRAVGLVERFTLVGIVAVQGEREWPC
jgi:hypothetical protein